MQELSEKRETQCLKKDSNSCSVHTQLLCYNTECVYKQLPTTTTSLSSPPTIAGQVGGQVNTALNLVNKELSQQCFTGIQLSQPLSWTYLLEVLPLLSENFYHYAINNFNLQRIIVSVCKVLVFALPMDLIKRVGLVSQWSHGPLSIGNGMKNMGACVRKLCLLTLIKRSNLLFPVPAKLKTVSLS